MSDVTLHHGDCLQILPTLDPASVWIVTDPPYGIGYAHSGKGAKPDDRGRGHRNAVRGGPLIDGDDQPFDPAPLLRFPNVLMWGANHFAHRLPPGGRWLAWDKRAESNVHDSFGDVDFAWHSRSGASRIINYLWKGVACEKRGESNGQRWHPSQKPVRVMMWSIEQAGVPPDGIVVDPYAGSGSTGVACLRMGLKCILVERDSRYLPVIEKRLKDAETPLFSGISD
jgi:site-specific DNA-methyltransferase (adenine-specific)